MKRILIIDDEEGVRESLRLILSEENKYALDFLNSAEGALEKIKKSPPDLVLLDIKMPKLDGIKALSQIKSAKKGLAVIMVTGYDSMETAKEALDKGASDYIVKPFDSDRVKKAVARILNQ
jgi:two-component system nitrogen regulation response regulator NtrX